MPDVQGHIKTKQPGEAIDYLFDFTDWFDDVDSADTISSSTVTADAGITLGTKSVSGDVVSQFISGGTDESDYNVVCKIVTSNARTKEADLTLRIRERGKAS